MLPGLGACVGFSTLLALGIRHTLTVCGVFETLVPVRAGAESAGASTRKLVEMSRKGHHSRRIVAQEPGKDGNV